MKSTSLKLRLAACGLALFAAQAVRADNPVNGAALYANNGCASSSCHGSSPLTSNGLKIYNGRNARSVIDAAITNQGDMAYARAAFPSGGSALADLAAYLGNTPGALSFASTVVGVTSATQTVTVNASLKGGSSISAMSVSTSGDFARSGGTCGTTVATGTSCTVQIAFTPTASGARSGQLSIAHNNTLTPISIALSGTGANGTVQAPIANISPLSITLAATAIGSTSAVQNISVSNSGNAPLAISALTLSNPADFSIAGGNCSPGGSVAADASCTVSVAFKPSAGALGTRSGNLTITHNATGSPGVVSLSGNATAAAAPVASMTASLAFGSVNLGTSSAAQTATLSNTGNAPLLLGSLSTGSTEFTLNGGSCVANGSVAVGANCTVNVGFTPLTAGARSASLVITHNASGGSSSTSLSGTGVALSPVIGVSPTTLSFSQVVNSTSAAQTATVSNSGNAPLLISALLINGAQASEFQLANGSTCSVGGSVAANASCVLKLAFTPTVTGARNANLSISHNAAGSPTALTLNGSGTALPQPAISLNATSLNFAAQTLGSSSAAQSVSVSNSGSATLTFSAFTLAGSAAADFIQGGTCTSTGSLAVGASCSVTFSFRPSATGARSATLTLTSNANNGAALLSLAGTGAALATPSVSLVPASLAFGNQTVGVTSTGRSVTLNNNGSGALLISGIAATSGFAVSHNCGASLAASASCTLTSSFTPTVAGAATGSISVVSNAPGSPHAVSLGGNGVAASPVLAWVPAAASLAFGDVAVGANPSARSLTLINQGPGTVTLQQLTLAGSQAADFSVGGTGSCIVGALLAQGASCTLDLAFQPAAVGARAALLQVVSSGTAPPDMALAGNGTAQAQASVSVVPASLSFSVAATATVVDAQTLTLHSSGNAMLRVASASVVSGGFTLAPASANPCPAAPFDLLPGQACALAVGWSSTAPGSESGMVEISTSASANPLQVSVQALRDAPAASPPGASTLSNAGAGGCSIARGHTLADPTLWLLALAAAGVLWLRRAGR